MYRAAAAPSIKMEYLDISPSPNAIPAYHQLRVLAPTSARSRKYSEAAQAAVRGASGVISTPERKKNGRPCASSSAANAASGPNRLRVKRYMKNDAIRPHRIDPARTPNA